MAGASPAPGKGVALPLGESIDTRPIAITITLPPLSPLLPPCLLNKTYPIPAATKRPQYQEGSGLLDATGAAAPGRLFEEGGPIPIRKPRIHMPGGRGEDEDSPRLSGCSRPRVRDYRRVLVVGQLV
ncbi:hypothetical protein SKAU_G00089640 [Synaphobranchus kaupii]|uniref:Uncharacterized protein n=1 Tax=Synaphobranchus kaupii TaxID=118154 RepID=A0A9Q1FWE3_SYNKA|nr:hypothetical protein SKAU_G00089640 [Synaphobranchus kaupii]